jgi:phage shock protein E
MRISFAPRTCRTPAVLGGLFTLLLLVAVALPCLAGSQPRNITSTQARELMAKDKKVVLLDVRTPEEYQQAHLHGAQLIPLGELERRVQEVPRDRPLLVYCAVGARSVSAAGLLSARGYRDIYQMSDGLVGWYKNGYPIER